MRCGCPFTGLTLRQFHRLVTIVAGRCEDEHPSGGRPWSLSLPERVLLIAVYYRTNLTLRQVALLFAISKSAAGRIVEHLSPLLVLAERDRPHPPERVLIVDGTLIPVHDHQVAASSKNYRFSANLQVVIDANTTLSIAVGRPLPGNRNDCKAYTESTVDQQCKGATVMSDGGYQGNPGVIMPYRKRRKTDPDLPDWKEDLNRMHRRVRARIEHAFAQMKCWNILRNCRRKGDAVWHATAAVALMRNLILTS